MSPERSDDTAPASDVQPARKKNKKNKKAAGAGGDGGGGGGRGRKGLNVQPADIDVPPPVPAAKPKKRHWFALVSFIFMVIGPSAGGAWYLYTRAADQYASYLGFSVQREEGPSASELLGGLASTMASSSSSSDTDILNEFIRSQDMVQRINSEMDLRTIFSRPEDDPVFALQENATLEELVAYWQRMVTISYDGGQGLLDIRVLAFRPQDAQDIARAVFDESSRMINELTAIAQEDATQFAREELEAAMERLKEARTALTEFRSRTQIVDPNADIQGQMGVLNNLQAQLAEALIELDLLRETARESDPRIRQTEQRIAVIRNRIEEERAKFGIGGAGARSGQAYATLVGDYESLVVEREFAEQTYLTALTNYDAAQAEAQRQSRYLAAYVKPTLAESSEYPKRPTLLAVMSLFAFMAWATVALVFYSIKDRR